MVCRSHTLHIDKISAKQYNKFSTVTMKKLTVCLLQQLTCSDVNFAMLAHIPSLMSIFHATCQACLQKLSGNLQPREIQLNLATTGRLGKVLNECHPSGAL